MATDLRAQLDHPAWRTAIATVLAYGVILVVLFVGLFVLPYLLFTLL